MSEDRRGTGDFILTGNAGWKEHGLQTGDWITISGAWPYGRYHRFMVRWFSWAGYLPPAPPPPMRITGISGTTLTWEPWGPTMEELFDFDFSRGTL